MFQGYWHFIFLKLRSKTSRAKIIIAPLKENPFLLKMLKLQIYFTTIQYWCFYYKEFYIEYSLKDAGCITRIYFTRIQFFNWLYCKELWYPIWYDYKSLTQILYVESILEIGSLKFFVVYKKPLLVRGSRATGMLIEVLFQCLHISFQGALTPCLVSGSW